MSPAGAVSGRRSSASISSTSSRKTSTAPSSTPARAPWFPRFVAGGVDNPPFDVTTWNQPELFKAASAGAAQGGFFVPVAEVQANVPNSGDLWDFAYESGHGITYLFSQLGYGYRTDYG